MSRHSEECSLSIVCHPAITCCRDLPRCSLESFGESRLEVWKYYTVLIVISSFSFCSWLINSLWICTDTVCVVGKSGRIVFGLIKTRQFLNAASQQLMTIHEHSVHSTKKHHDLLDHHMRQIWQQHLVRHCD